jgi:hypothetical protein
MYGTRRSPWLYSMSTWPGNAIIVCMWPAVATGPVKCGTMPTLWVSHTAMIFSISVMPPTLGSDARAKSMSRCSTSGLNSARVPLAGRQRYGRQ